MSHFYGSIQGNRGAATRQGTKQSGIETHIRGWNIGCLVKVFYDEKQKVDIVRVYKTSGSNNKKGSKLIAEYVDGGTW